MRGQQMGLYRDQGIVLKGIRLGEADRILSVYTQNHGRIRVVAKGIRKSKSRFGGRLDAFTHVELMLYSGRGDLDTITQVDMIKRFPRLRADYAAFTSAAAMADAVDRTTPDRERNVSLFLQFRAGLTALDAGADDPALLAYAFLAKVASMGGHHPMLGACVGCGAGERSAFSMGNGGAVCSSCLERSDPPASTEALDVWSALIGSDWEPLRTMKVPDPTKREVAGLLLGFVQWQMDNRLRAFGLLAAT